MFKIERMIEYLEENKDMRPIAKKYAANRHFLIKLYPRLLNLGVDSTIEDMIADAIDIDRKIRKAKQDNPHLKGDTELEKNELEERAREDLGYTQNTMTTFLGGVPTCPICQTEIKFMGVEDGEEVYKCKCGLCDETKPEIKN